MMRHNRLSRHGFPLALLLAGTLLASCSQDMLDDGQGNSLPEGKYPLELTASLTAATSTRATVDGTWEEGDIVTVQVEDAEGSTGTYQYTADADGSLTSTSPYYWKDTSRPVRVSAWHYGSNIFRTSTGTWIVKSNQNENSGFPASDFIYAPPMEMTFSGQNDGTNPTLTFYHQVAKVVVNIRNTGIAADMDITDVKLNGVYLSGNYTTIDEEIEEGVPVQGSWQTTGNKAAITMGRMEAVQEANFGDGAETAKASYSALVIPQQTANQDIKIEIGINGATYAWSLNNVLAFKFFEGGYQYTFNITVQAEGLNVYEYKYPTWEEGNSGSGSITITN